MTRVLFQNSKIALMFVAMTVLGAVAMIGTSEDSGLLPRVVSFASAARASAGGDGQGQVQRQEPGSGATGQPASVFGDYTQQQGMAPAPAGGAPAAQQSANPMTAPLSPTAVVMTNSAPPASGGN